MRELNYLIAAVAWVFGLALAQGWWKLLAIIPLYGWYETAKWVLSEVQTVCPI